MKSNFSIITLKYIAGIFLLIIGICLNKHILGLVFSPYAIIELNNRFPVGFVSFLFTVSGLVVVFLKRRWLSLNAFIRGYKYVAITLFSVVALFFVVNLLIYALFLFKDITIYQSQIFLSYRQPLTPLYSGLAKKQINELLYETWSRPYIYEPYTQFKERPFRGKYINVSENGFRHVKNQGPWPPSPDNLNIFFFGGSTVFGYGVKDEDSISSYLQEIISESKKKVFIYNFGRGNYFSSQERILFEKLLTEGFVPDVVIFMDGLNDFYYGGDEPLFTEKFKLFVEGKRTSSMPLLRLLDNVKSKKKNKVKFHRQEVIEKDYNDETLISSAVERYLRNKKAIEHIAKASNIKPFFIWQPVPTYKYDLKYHIFAGKGFGRFMYSKYGYAYMEEFVKKHNMGDNFLWLADMQENMKKPLYIDIDHYSPEMSKEVAIQIANFLKSRI